MRMNENLNIYELSKINNLKVHGRTTEELAPLTLFWTGSSLELNAKGSELWIEVEVDYDVYEPWITIAINSSFVSRQMLTEGRYWVCIFRGMSYNVAKNVRIIKEVQAMSGDQSCSFKIHGVKFDGEFLPIEEKPYKIEFIGDSITSGEGSVGAKSEEDWIPMFFSAVKNYTFITAEALNAEYRIISQSGWGVLTSWDNNPHANIPKYYEKVCGVLSGEKNEALGAFKDNNFKAWQPDVVVVNLGTNDGSAFNSPMWKDDATGETHKQRLNEDGTFNSEDLKAFKDAVFNFLVKLRMYNRKAHILWAYGMLGNTMAPAIKKAVVEFTEKTGDKKTSYLQLPDTTTETVGSRNHPGALAHEKAAKELITHLEKILSI